MTFWHFSFLSALEWPHSISISDNSRTIIMSKNDGCRHTLSPLVSQAQRSGCMFAYAFSPFHVSVPVASSEIPATHFTGEKTAS